MPAPVTTLDVERFLYSPPEDSASSGSEDLPVIGTSALEQILCPSSPSSISSKSSSFFILRCCLRTVVDGSIRGTWNQRTQRQSRL